MTWSPVNYGGIKDIRVPPDKIWLPDIVREFKFNKYKILNLKGAFQQVCFSSIF